jgi:adenylate kinase
VAWLVVLLGADADEIEDRRRADRQYTANVESAELDRDQRDAVLNRLITFRNRLVMSSATITATCSYCG